MTEAPFGNNYKSATLINVDFILHSDSMSARQTKKKRIWAPLISSFRSYTAEFYPHQLRINNPASRLLNYFHETLHISNKELLRFMMSYFTRYSVRKMCLADDKLIYKQKSTANHFRFKYKISVQEVFNHSILIKI